MRSRSPVVQQQVVSPWVQRGIVLAFLAVIAGGVGAWVSGMNKGVAVANTVNAVQDVKLEKAEEAMDDIQGSLRRIEDKVDNLKK